MFVVFTNGEVNDNVAGLAFDNVSVVVCYKGTKLHLKSPTAERKNVWSLW
jgi:hypothetical protein